MSNEQPIGLEKLPGYLNSNRENLNDENSCVVVDMGRIVENKRRFPLPLAFAVAAFLFIGATATYSLIPTTQQITIVVDINEDVDNPQTISEIVKNSGGKIISLKKNGSVYEVKVSTRKRLSFLELLHKNKNVNKAEEVDRTTETGNHKSFFSK